MRLLLLTFLTYIPLVYSAHIHAGFYSEMDIFAYSEPVTVNGALDDWKGTFFGGEVALTHKIIETGWKQDHYQIGIFRRYDYELSFSEDTAEITYKIKNKVPLQVNRQYQLDLSVRNSYTQGVHIRYRQQFNRQWSLVAGVSILQGIKLTEGRLKGNATTISESNYNIQFDVDYYYSKDQIFKRETIAPMGYGLSTDVVLYYQYKKKNLATLKIVDLFGRILWADTPRTVAQANNNNSSIGQDGWVEYQPTLSGKHSRSDFLQKLNPMITLSNRYQVNRSVSLTTSIYHTQVINLYDIGIIYEPKKSTQLQLSLMPELKALTLGVKTKNFNFSITSDRLKFQQSKVLGMRLGFNFWF